MKNQKIKKPFYMNYRSLEDYMVANNRYLESIGFAPDTLDDLHSQGITTPQELAYYELTDSYVELHDLVYGFKPRNVNRLSLSQIEKRYNKLTERA